MKKRAREFTYETFNQADNRGIDIKCDTDILTELLEFNIDEYDTNPLYRIHQNKQLTTQSLQEMEKKYGRTITAFYYFTLLNEHILTDGSYNSGTGGYDYWMSEGYLTANEMQSVDMKLEIYEYGMQLIIEFLFAIDESLAAIALKDYYRAIKLEIDTRDSISSRDTEWEKMYQELDKILDKNDTIQLNNRNHYECLEFENDKLGELLNREESYKLSRELYDMFDIYNIHEKFKKEFKKELDKPRKLIKLNVCPTTLSTINVFSFYFTDTHTHPGKNLNTFKEAYERFLQSEDSIMYIETFSDHIVNYIQWLVNKTETKLFNDQFKYWDLDGKEYDISMVDGKFEPAFPKGFYDLTLDKIFDLNDNL